MSTIGWTKERTDEVLGPVIRDMNRRANEGTQSNMTAFFTGSTGAGAFAPRRTGGGGDGGLLSTSGVPGRKPASKRMEGALGRLKEGAKRKRGSAEVDDDEMVPQQQQEEKQDNELEDPKDGGQNDILDLDPDATVGRAANAGRAGSRAKNIASTSRRAKQGRSRKGRKTA